MAESSSCQLCLIGGFELCCNGSAHDLPEAAKRLVAFLALHPKPQVRSYVSGSLWPDKPESRAAANLRSALWRLTIQACQSSCAATGACSGSTTRC